MTQAIFVGREREQRMYQDMLGGDSAWVLVITGQGGNGKSTLLRRFAEQTAGDTPVVMLDFTGDLSVDALAVMERIAQELEAHCQKQAVQAFQKALQQGRKELTASKSMSETIIASEHATVTGNTLAMSAAANEQRRQVREAVRTSLLALMDTLRAGRLVLLFDTCERLLEAEGLGMSEVGQWVLNDLLPGLYARLQRKRGRCLVVIAGRIYPQLEAIDEQERRHLTLPMLDRAAVDDYLQHVGMQDTALRERVYELTHGHALCVSIIGALWQERDDRPFTNADLPQLQAQFSERALLKFVGERILDRRLKTPFRELTRYGVLLRRFNLPTLRAVFSELLPESEALERFHQLLRYPYVESLGNHHHAFHDLLREIQAEEIREQEPEKWQRYHKRALDYLARTAPQSPDWYYHAIACDEEQGMSDWWDAVQEPRNYGTAYLGELFQAAYDGTLKLMPELAADRTFRLGRFYFTSYGTHLNAALGCYEEALVLYRQVGSKLGEANVLQAMGDVQQFRKDMQAALQSYQQALTLFQQVGDRLGEANVLQAMGDVQQFRDDRQAALQSYQQALTLFQQVGSKLGEANCYLAQGRVALEEEDYQKALTLHTDAYGLYQDIQASYS